MERPQGRPSYRGLNGGVSTQSVPSWLCSLVRASFRTSWRPLCVPYCTTWGPQPVGISPLISTYQTNSVGSNLGEFRSSNGFSTIQHDQGRLAVAPFRQTASARPPPSPCDHLSMCLSVSVCILFMGGTSRCTAGYDTVELPTRGLTSQQSLPFTKL